MRSPHRLLGLAAAWIIASAIGRAAPMAPLPLPQLAPTIAGPTLDPIHPDVYPEIGTAAPPVPALSPTERKIQTDEYLAQAKGAEARGDAPAALACLTAAIETNPGDFAGALQQARTDRARLRQAHGDTVGAIADFDQLVAHYPMDYLLVNGRGLVKMEARDYPGALDDFDLAIAVDPDRPAAYVNRAIVKTRQKDFRGAHAEIDLALAKSQTDPLIYFNRAYLWREEGSLTNERADLERTTELAPNFFPALFALGRVCLHSLEYSDAIGFLNRALKLRPNDAPARLTRGIALQATGRNAAAEADFIAAINNTTKSDDFTRIHLWVAQNRTRPKHHGGNALTAVLDSKDEWINTIAKLLVGDLTNDQFSAASLRIPAKDSVQRRCETAYFLGVAAQLDDDSAAAVEHFRDCIATGCVDDYDYVLASGELARLAKSNED